MGDWLEEKLIGVAIIIVIVTMATMVNSGSAPADPLLFIVVLAEKLVVNLVTIVVVGAAGLLKWLGWLLIPVGVVWLMVIASRTPDRLTVSVTHDKDGLPTVSWYEPRYEGWRWFSKTFTVQSACWLRATPDRWIFCHRVTSSRSEKNAYVEVPFGSVIGFSLTDGDTLYGTGGTRSEDPYSQQLVVRADLYPAHNGIPLIPLTFTCAPRSEVEGLHQALVSAFSGPSLTPAFDLIVERYARYEPGRRENAGQAIPGTLD